jgi:hypothetical protein
MSTPILPHHVTQPFAKSLPPSRAPSRASSQASLVSSQAAGLSNLNGLQHHFGDKTDRLEHIFTSVINGATSPTLAKETFCASQNPQHPQTSRTHTHHHTSTHASPRREPPISTSHQHQPPNAPPRRDPPITTTNFTREQADFEAAQFALKQVKLAWSPPQ